MVNKKVFKIIWDINALEDFKEILAFLANKNPQAPKIVKKAVLSRLATIKLSALNYEEDNLKEENN